MLLFFSCLFLLLFLGFLVVRFGKIQVELENLEKRSVLKKQKDLSSLRIAFLFGDSIKLLKIRIKEKGRLLHKRSWVRMKIMARQKGWTKKWKREVEKISKEDGKEILRQLWKEKNIQMKIRKLDLLLRIGVDDVIWTSYLVSVLAMLTSILLSAFGKEKWTEDYHYRFRPSYQGNWNYQFRLSTTIHFSIYQMIRIIWWFYRWEKEKEKIQKEAMVPD